ncbi:MAG: type III-A CRISPR-associated protein Csm2 [Clostridia bacterium]|nr:type III-A CRISPR-associated protein Csm2 [Clostridia bacterium]
MSKLNEQTYVNDAEEVIRSLITENRWGGTELKLSTSKIRNLLSLISAIYNDVRQDFSETLSEEIQSRIRYLKVRFVYESGREQDVKEFVKKAKILEYLDEIEDSRKRFLAFAKYMEALVAYHKYHGGRD